MPVARLFDGPLARHTRELRVVLLLEPGESRPVDADEPYYLRRKRSGRVVPLRHREESDPGQVEIFDSLGDVQIDLPRNVGERPVSPQGGQDLLRFLTKGVGDLCGLTLWIRDQRGIRVDVSGIERDRERHTSAIEDLAACGGKVERLDALIEPEGLERAPVPDLQDRETCRDAAEREQHEREQHDETPPHPTSHEPPDGVRPKCGTRRMTTVSGSTI